jgi:hypothetical protein
MSALFVSGCSRHVPDRLGGDSIAPDLGPLTIPIVAHLIASLDVATFHSICPNEVGIDGRKNAFDVPAIEEGIDSS